jgi:hypothetical protein
MPPTIDADARLALEDRLNRLAGVVHASVNPLSGDVWVVHEPESAPGPVEVAVRNLLVDAGRPFSDASVRLAVAAPAEPRRRVRFVDVARAEDSEGVTISVRLEWNDVVHTGSARGERGSAVELKTTAQAALDALETVSGQALALRIIGVKQIHAFDSTLMVVSMIRGGDRLQRLVGAVIVDDQPMRSAALAVLSGLNRFLGNFLHTSD